MNTYKNQKPERRNKLGTKLRRLRQMNDFTQTEIAAHLFISQSCYSAYECGAFMPSIASLNILARLYEIPITDLLKEELYCE